MEGEVKEDRERQAMVHQVLDMQHIHQLDSDRRRLCIENIPGGMYNMSCSQLLALANTAGSSSSVVAGSSFPSYGPDSQISMDSWVNSWKMESNPWSLTPESYIGTNTSIARDTAMELPQYEVPNFQKFICDLNLTPEETVTATKPRPTQPEFSPIALDTPGKRFPETEQKHVEPIDKPFRETRTPAGGEKKRKRASATTASAGEKAAQLNTPLQVSRKRKKVRAKVVREGDTKPKRTVSKPSAVKKKASAKTPAAKTSEENSYVQRPKRSTRRSLKFDNVSEEEEEGFCGLTFTSEGCIGISVGGKIIPDATMGVFGNIPKRRRTNGRNYVSSTQSLVDMVPATFMEPNGNFPGDDTHISQNHLKTLTRKRSSRVRRARKIGSMKRILKGLVGTIKGPIKRGRRGYKTPLKPPELKAIVSEMQSDVSRKKRSNRDPIESLLNAKVLQLQWSQQHSTGASTLETWEQKAICRLFEDLNINRESPCLPHNTETAITLHQEACQELSAMVQYVTDLKNYQPKVELDDETTRVWNLLVVSIDSEGIDGLDEDKQKWWEEERKMFHERANLFIARMRLVQGDRRFSPWKGSVVDSVVGVFLTQNVADHSSSSAFMDLAAEFPVISNSIEGSCYYEELESSVTDETVVNLDSGNAVETPRKRSPTCIVIDEIDDGDDTDAVCSLETSKTSVLLDSLTNSDQGMSTVSSTSTCWELNLNEAPLEVENCDAFRNSIDEGSLVQPTSNYQQELEKSILQAQDQEKNTSTDMKDKNKVKKSPKKKTKTSPKGKSAKKKPAKTKPKDSFDWDSLRKHVEAGGQKRERTERTMDTVDWDALRCTNVHDIAEIIKKRGMYNMLASRIKTFLNRLVRDHEEIDLEWLRDVPPDKAKEFLLSINGLGLKSVDCVRLLSLHQLAFPVDTNVGRIAVRLGWVPLQPLPDEVQMHLLELYPVLANVQKYLWPRLCKLDQKTLYELHYHMITFGKVFCTKQKPNCKACPMKAECRHYASACASARLALQDAEETNTVTIHDRRYKSKHVDVEVNFQQSSFFLTQEKEQEAKTIQNFEPIIEEPATPEPEYEEQEIEDIEDYPSENNYEISTSFARGGTSENPWENKDVIPTIMLNKEADISNELVVLSTHASSIPRRKLKTNERLRTEHLVYELPDFHPILEGFERRDRDDEFPYLLAIWTPGETTNSSLPPRRRCVFYERNALCHRKRCFPCNNFREEKSQTVRGTILIPCRTAMRGSFPLNGTYFQTNEVFADHETSVDPINVPRECIWNLRRRIAYFGSSVSASFAGLPVEAIQYGFWRGYVCVRGFDRRTRKPEILTKRLHCPPSKKNQEEDF